MESLHHVLDCVDSDILLLHFDPLECRWGEPDLPRKLHECVVSTGLFYELGELISEAITHS